MWTHARAKNSVFFLNCRTCIWCRMWQDLDKSDNIKMYIYPWPKRITCSSVSGGRNILWKMELRCDLDKCSSQLMFTFSFTYCSIHFIIHVYWGITFTAWDQITLYLYSQKLDADDRATGSNMLLSANFCAGWLLLIFDLKKKNFFFWGGFWPRKAYCADW